MCSLTDALFVTDIYKYIYVCLHYGIGHNSIDVAGVKVFSIQVNKRIWANILCFADRASQYNPRNITNLTHDCFFLICLFQFSACFEQSCAHHQDSQMYQHDIWYMSLCIGDRLVCMLGWNIEINV